MTETRTRTEPLTDVDFLLHHGREMIKLSGCGCRSFFCPDCGGVRAFRAFSALMERWQYLNTAAVAFITLTFSPQLIPGDNQTIWRTVQRRRLIGEWMRYVKSEVRRIKPGFRGDYFCKMEFGERGGRLHYHLFVDNLWLRPWVRHEKECFERIMKWWRDRCGRIDAEVIQLGGDVNAIKRAAGYVAKYVAKGSKGAPDWVRDLEGSHVRVVRCSLGYWLKSRFEQDPLRPELGKKTPRGSTRPLGVRLDECGSTTAVSGFVMGDDGGLGHNFMGKIERPLGELVSSLSDATRDLGMASMWVVHNKRGTVRQVWLSTEAWERCKGLVVLSAPPHPTTPAGDGGPPPRPPAGGRESLILSPKHPGGIPERGVW